MKKMVNIIAVFFACSYLANLHTAVITDDLAAKAGATFVGLLAEIKANAKDETKRKENEKKFSDELEKFKQEDLEKIFHIASNTISQAVPIFTAYQTANKAVFDSLKNGKISVKWDDFSEFREALLGLIVALETTFNDEAAKKILEDQLIEELKNVNLSTNEFIDAADTMLRRIEEVSSNEQLLEAFETLLKPTKYGLDINNPKAVFSKLYELLEKYKKTGKTKKSLIEDQFLRIFNKVADKKAVLKEKDSGGAHLLQMARLTAPDSDKIITILEKETPETDWTNQNESFSKLVYLLYKFYTKPNDDKPVNEFIDSIKKIKQDLWAKILLAPIPGSPYPLLHLAAQGGTNKMVLAMLEHLSDDLKKDGFIDSEAPDHLSPLMVALGSNNIAASTILLEKGANVHQVTPEGLGTLHYAAIGNIKDKDIITRLVNGNASQEKDSFGRTPLDIAQDKNHKEFIEILTKLNQTAELNQKENLEKLSKALNALK